MLPYPSSKPSKFTNNPTRETSYDARNFQQYLIVIKYEDTKYFTKPKGVMIILKNV